MNRPVMVVNGGRSLEREVSLRSGRRAADALKSIGYEVVQVDPDERFVARVKDLSPQFAFIAMHGRGGEDGTLQDLLEILDVPYTGSDVHASAQCLDKHAFKEMLAGEGLSTPAWHSFNRTAFSEFGAVGTLGVITAQLGYPLVIKPSREGSSLGLKIISSDEEFAPALVGSFSYDDRVVIEHFIDGRELAVSVLGPAGSPEALPIVEIFTTEPFYNFRAHYEEGAARMEIAVLDDQVETRVRSAALRAYAAAGCRDLARVDVVLDAAEQPQILEINTIPGLTETGPTPFAADAMDLNFTDLIARVIERVK